MGKIIVVILMSLMIIGCGERIIYKDVLKPVLICPEPPEVEQPDLMVNKLKIEDANDPGKVALYYKASIIQLQNQIRKFELIIDEYKNISDKTPPNLNNN